MKTVSAEAVPVHQLLNSNGHANGNDNGSLEALIAPPPHLTAQGLRKLLERENNPCGPALFLTRLQAVSEAKEAAEPKLLAGALEDLAAAAVGWSYRVRLQAGIWPKTKAS